MVYPTRYHLILKSIRITFASAGVGAGSHMAGELMMRLIGAAMVHVPYLGNGPATKDLLAGHVSSMFLGGLMSLPPIRDGRLRAIGFTTAKRLKAAPEFPTMGELGLAGFEVGSWTAPQAPAGTPADIIARLADETHRFPALPEVRAKLGEMGIDAAPATPQATATFIRAEVDRWAEVVKATNMKPA